MSKMIYDTYDMIHKIFLINNKNKDFIDQKKIHDLKKVDLELALRKLKMRNEIHNL